VMLSKHANMLHYLSSVLAVPTSTDDSSSQLVTVIIAETLEESCRRFHPWRFFNLHPEHTQSTLTESTTKLIHNARGTRY